MITPWVGPWTSVCHEGDGLHEVRFCESLEVRFPRATLLAKKGR